MAADLVGNWRADDLTGVVSPGDTAVAWADAIGGLEATGSIADGPTFEVDQIEGRPALRFGGRETATGLQISPSDSPMSGLADFTVLVAFSTDSSDLIGAQGPWFENTSLVDYNSFGLNPDWGLTINADGQLSAGFRTGFGSPPIQLFSSATGLNDGQLHTAVVVRSGSDISLHVDDRPADTRNDGPTSALRANTLGIGQLSTNTHVFEGLIADVQIYNGALDPAEIESAIADVTTFYNNRRPDAAPDEYSISEDFPFLFVGPAQGVLANDEDADGDALTARLIKPPDHGTLTLQENGAIIYAVDKDFFGADTFTYSAVDFRPSEPVTVTINVTPVYDPVLPSDDEYRGLPGDLMVFDAADGVLYNDVNVDQVPLTVTLKDDVGEGQLVLSADGSFTYDPQDFAGSTSFTYEVDDGTQISAPVTVTLILNSPPQSSPNEYEILEDTKTAVPAVLGVLANDVDADDNNLKASIVSPPTHGTLQMNDDGSFSYDPNDNYFGPDAFSYVASDGFDQSEVVQVQLNIVSVNDPALAQDDTYVAVVGATLDVSGSRGLLANDSDVDSPTMQSLLLDGPSNGTIELNSDGSFSYTPSQGFIGKDVFRYTANDTLGDSAPATVSIYVDPTPIVISEIMAANSDLLLTRTRETPEMEFGSHTEDTFDWIEIRNPFATPLDISGFHLTDDESNLTKWQFPTNTILPADGHFVVFASGRNIRDPALDLLGMLHTNFSLQLDGEYLGVTSPNGVVLHEFGVFPRQEPDVSYGATDAVDLAYFVTPTPGLANSATYAGVVADTVVSVERGFFSEAFQVEIESATAGAQIRYTTDGSTPTQTHGRDYAGPLDVTTTTTLRSAAFRDGSVPSRTSTHTYLFIEDVINQGNSPEGYPDKWGLGGPSTAPWEPRPADYEMDPEITQNPAYKDLIDDALMALPSVSIVTSIENLFDPETGIYQNTQGHGLEWERPASIEMINPDGTTAFQIDAGIRMQGGASREPWKNPKHGFRLKFKGIYGAEKLKFDWFGGDAVDEFDEIVLRSGANQSWLHHNQFLGDNRGRAQYVRDQWINETYRAMGRPAAHNAYAHLYVNGIYWGLYNPKERPTESFAASYLGGEKEQYDVLNSGSLLAGTTDAWRELNGREFRTNLKDPAVYAAAGEVLDIPAFIDYMIMNHYGGNLDWDSHNWYAINDRSPGGKFIFSPWDGEFIFIEKGDNVVPRAEAAPGRLLNFLRTNSDFKMLMADHIQKHFFNGGVLTTERVVERWDALSQQIEVAIIAESARWGDYRRDVDSRVDGPFVLLERDIHWRNERERLLTDYFPFRNDIVLDQYRNRLLFPSIDAPTFNQRGGRVPSGFDVELSAAEGIVYYTLDGTDPRLPGGAISDSAIEYSGPIQLDQPVSVHARAMKEDEWSAIDQAEFVVGVVPADTTNVRISEIHFNPADPTDAERDAGHTNNDDFEFIELVNTSSQRVDLSNVQLRRVDVEGELQGVEFDFSTGMVPYLEAGQRLIVVEDVDAFAFREGRDLAISGQWVGRLNNAGEQLTLAVGDDIVHQFTYSDDWYPETDGGGSSLEIIDPGHSDLASWSQKLSWRASQRPGGSPGWDSTITLLGDANHDGVFDTSDFTLVLMAGEYEDGIPENSTFEEGDWDGDGDFTSADFVAALATGTFVKRLPAVSVELSPVAAALEMIDADSDSPHRLRTDDRKSSVVENTMHGRFLVDSIAARAIESIFADPNGL